MTKQTRWGFAAIFIAIGVACAAAGWNEANRFQTLSARGARAEALVVSYNEVRGRRRTSWYPVYQFSVHDGRSIEVTSGDTASPTSLPRGSRVTIVYDPRNPESVMTETALRGRMGVMPWFLGFMTVVMFGTASLFLMSDRWSDERR